MPEPELNNKTNSYNYQYVFEGPRLLTPSRKTIYDQNPVNAFYGLLGWNNVSPQGINDLSSDNHLGGQEINNFLRNIHFDERSIDSRYGKGTLNRWKDTFKRWVNNRISNNNKYFTSPQQAADREVLKLLMDEVNLLNVKYDPLTGNALYYGNAGYDQGVSANDWLTANSQYTTARDDYARSLISKEYDNYLQNSLKDTSWKVNNQYGWNGDSKLTQTDVYNLIKHAGDAGSDLILNKRLDAYLDSDYKNFIFGDKSKAAFAKALDYYKKNNPALYNAILNSSNYGEFLGNNANYTKIDRLEPTKEGMSKWWEETKNNNQKLVKSIDEQANSTANVKLYLDDLKRAQQRQSTPAKFTSANLTLFKLGGKMNKYQQGGQAPTAALMVLQALSAAQQGDQSGLQQLFSDKKTAQAVIQQLQKEAQEGSEEAIQALEALKQIMSRSKKQATMALKGAKLSYIHRLATGCPPGMEMTYFKKGGRLCKACIEKAKKAKEGASGDGVLSEAPKRSKYGFGGFFEYFKCGGKPKKPKCGTKAKCGAELEKCGGKTPMDKCGGKTPMTKCGGKAPMDKCGGKTTLAKCGTELKKCGGKAKKSSPKKPVVNKDKCGGKAKKHAIGGNLELLKYMILNYNK